MKIRLALLNLLHALLQLLHELVRQPQLPLLGPQRHISGPQRPVLCPQLPVLGEQLPVLGAQLPVLGGQQELKRGGIVGEGVLWSHVGRRTYKKNDHRTSRQPVESRPHEAHTYSPHTLAHLLRRRRRRRRPAEEEGQPVRRPPPAPRPRAPRRAHPRHGAGHVPLAVAHETAQARPADACPCPWLRHRRLQPEGTRQHLCNLLCFPLVG